MEAGRVSPGAETPRILKGERFQNIFLGILTPEEFDLDEPNSE